MIPVIAQRLEALEQRRVALVDRVRALPPQQQTAHPDAKSFSPLEVVAHLALSEQVHVDRMRTLGPKELIGKQSKTTFVFRMILDRMNRAQKSPAPSMVVPEARVPLETSARSWEYARKELALILNNIKYVDDPVEQYFLFGTLSAGDLLSLFEAHLHYHEVHLPQA
jgi:hypothetical protein